MSVSDSWPGCSTARRWRRVPGVRYLAQDRLQDLPALQGLRPGWPDRSQPTTLPARQPAAVPDREADRSRSSGSDPSWGAPKIREKLRRQHSDVQTPAISTVHAVLYRHGLVNRGRKRRYKAQGTALSRPLRPNDLWCADYKGEFMLADQALLLPAHHQRLRQPLPPQLRGPVDHPGGLRLHRVRARFQGVRLTHRRSAPTTACPSPAPMRCSA